MEITEVKVFPVNEEKLKAFVTITLDDCFIVRDLKIIKGQKGLFVAMPSKKRKDGAFRDIAHPLNNETRQTIETKIISAYEETMKASGTAHVSADEAQDAQDSTSEEF
ncbi:MAG: septation regulator SpoVG [Deltaproteobacteria bacterium]|nr:septation regulator SpoVG [Deltaproteobacteria bacterium]